MAITLRCPCGALIPVADDTTTTRCTSCQALLAIPGRARPVAAPPPLPSVTARPARPAGTPPPLPRPSATGAGPADPQTDAYQLESIRTCPKCRKQWPEKTVICIDCGYNFRTGKKLERAHAAREDFVELGTRAIGSYSRYTVRQDRDGRRSLILESWLLWVPSAPRILDLWNYDTIATDYGVEYGDQHSVESYSLELQGPRAQPVEIWSGSSDDDMRALIGLLQKRAGLTVRRK